jgi:mannose-6-phosphate isomerase-like protein (cupin superfamily)
MIQGNLGDYDVLADIETPECSLRLLKLSKDRFVRPHHHHQTTQTYFVLEGIIEATLGDKTVVLKPHQILRVSKDTLHGIRAEAEALVLSISIPPLDSSDQHLAPLR